MVMIVVLGDVEHMLADTTGEPLDWSTITVRDERGDVHMILVLFLKLLILTDEDNMMAISVNQRSLCSILPKKKNACMNIYSSILDRSSSHKDR